jgi:hypothetical protein
MSVGSTLTAGEAGGLLAMSIPTREPLVAYVLDHAAMLRRQRDTAPAAAESLEKHSRALELLADLVRGLPEDDERLLLLGTLAVRNGRFVPGPAAEHAMTHFAATSVEACDAFLTSLVQIARDDAIARARAHGQLPHERPR